MYVHGVTLLSCAANAIQYYTLDYNVKSNRSSQVVDPLPVHGSGVGVWCIEHALGTIAWVTRGNHL